MGYQVEGRLLEVCDCNVLCPCWIGEDPDNGTCESVLAWHIDTGEINGVDVSGLTIAGVTFIPGNVLDGNFRENVYISEEATDEQMEAILDVWTGKLGGAIADLAQLIGEVVVVERAPITFTVEEGKGTLKIGANVEAVMAPYVGATGKPTTLNESIFSTIPGSPAYVAKADRYRVDMPEYGFNIDLTGHNAIQGDFRFEA